MTMVLGLMVHLVRIAGEENTSLYKTCTFATSWLATYCACHNRKKFQNRIAQDWAISQPQPSR
jgi:hypothetical protein